MKVLVTGVSGQLGHDVVRRLQGLNIQCKGCDLADFDLTNEEQTTDAVLSYAPDVVVHCAAYTAVDKAEDNRELCYDINVNGTKYIARVCKQIGAKLMYFSTDYVFDGTGEHFWKPGDEKAPVNYYGVTKALGEDEVTKAVDKYFIIRISWVFGVNGHNFVKTMINLGRTKTDINVVCDQVGSPTYTQDLAVLVCDMLQTDKYGVYHAGNEGLCSWYEFACEIMEDAGLQCNVHPIETKHYPTKAARPMNSRLDKSSLTENGFPLLPQWKDALKRYIDVITKI